MASLDKKPGSSTRSGKDQGIENPSDSDGAAPAGNQHETQGEGNYQAAREFNAAEHKFVESGKVPAAARAAAPQSEAERREMAAAEEKGKQRAKGGSDQAGEKTDHPPATGSARGSSTLRLPAKHAERKPG